MATIIIKGNRKISVNQTTIARECGISPQAVSQFFNGVRPLPDKYIPIMKKHKVPLRIFRKKAA